MEPCLPIQANYCSFCFALIASVPRVETILEFLKNLHSPEGITQIIISGGLLALVGIVFAETGLLVGFFLPGDSLLVTAGIIAAQKTTGGDHLLNIWNVNLAMKQLSEL